MKSELFFILFLVGFSCFSQLPEGFIDVEKVIPDITVELRYHTSNNFVGRPIDGYQANTLILTKEAAYALQQVQEELENQNQDLQTNEAIRKVCEGRYRP